MKRSFSLLLPLVMQVIAFGQSAAITAEQYRQDYQYFWTSINDEYAYFNKKHTDWQKVKDIYLPMIGPTTTRDQFVSVLEKSLAELYDHHSILNTNTDSSRRLVPSGTDIWAEYIDGRPMVTSVRKNFGAEKAGIAAGMEIIAVNGIPVKSAVAAFLPKTLSGFDNEALSYALRILLSGNHVVPRVITASYHGITKDYFPDQPAALLEHIQYNGKIATRMIGTTGYIKINDCLYDNELIAVFDSVMLSFKNTSSLILDLRETPSGGNTTVAKTIVGWFTREEHFYQKHEYPAEEKQTGVKRSWEEIVSPRKGKYYGKPLVILCNRWTGSIAEGIVIAFDALKRPSTKIIGTRMAQLNGAVYPYEMPNTKIHFTFTAEKLYHINGLPREEYIPPVYIDWRKEEDKPGRDVFMEKALQFLKLK